MKKIYESVAFGIVAVKELGDLIKDERNEDKRDALECSRYAYYYLIDNMNKQFGVTRIDVVNALVENGYERRLAIQFVDEYEAWACHVVKINEKGDFT